MLKKRWEDPETRIAKAKLAFHDARVSGYVNMLDGPMPYDPEGTAIALIVDVRREHVIRCALSRQQAKNLAAKLMECL